MSQQVQFEDGTVHEFPDEATPDMMSQALGVKLGAEPHADVPFDAAHGTKLALGDVVRGVVGAAPRIIDATDRLAPWAYNTFRPDSMEPVGYPPSINEGVQNLLTKAGLPTPENATERVVSSGIQNIPFGPGGVIGGALAGGINELPVGDQNFEVAGRDIGISPKDVGSAGVNMMAMGALSPKPYLMGDIADSEAGRLAKINMKNDVPVYPTDVLPETGTVMNFINSTPFSGKQGRGAEQAAALTSAAVKTMGEQGGELSPPVLGKAFERIGKDFQDFASRNDVSPQNSMSLLNGLSDYQKNQMRFMSGDNIRRLTEHSNDILDAIGKDGSIPGTRWQSIQSDIGRKARATVDPEYEQGLYAYQKMLRQAMRDGLPEDEAAKFDTANAQYRAALALEKASVKAVGTGVANPQALEAGVKKVYPNYASNDPNQLPQITQAAQLLKQAKARTQDFGMSMHRSPMEAGQFGAWVASPLAAMLNRTLNTRINPMDFNHPYGAAAYRAILGGAANPLDNAEP